jgi:hypothetical protein
VSFSAGLLTAIIKVNATNVLSAILLFPLSSNNIPLRSKKYKNKNAAMRLFPSENEWFFVIKP